MLRIYLADLVYDTVKSNYVVPLNAGYLAAMLDAEFGSRVDIRIFKYPTGLEAALRETPPDVLGLSHYSWNSSLDRLFVEMAKRLRPETVTVMGGPNIRVEPEEIAAFLRGFPLLDHYVLFAGELPLRDMVASLLDRGEVAPNIPGVASLRNGDLNYVFRDQRKQAKTIDFPSPYLSGWMDPFIADPTMIPLLETNRGCPFSCAYCTWGIAALAMLKLRPLEVVYQEMEYLAEHSAGQVNWIFCDANFGIIERDVEIAQRIRAIKDRKGFPVKVTLWQSKNTSRRNVRISELVGDVSSGYIAIQSSDPVVLENTGRGNINMKDIRATVAYYRERHIPVLTDLLLGLPGETRASHLQSIADAFDMGFDRIQPYNIRMLPGSRYESPEYRERFGVRTKFRPIFGAYGVYDGRRVFEIEESVRATDAMTEDDLDWFKVLHWLLYFCWNSRSCRPPLELARSEGINPTNILEDLAGSPVPALARTYQAMRDQSRGEWFDTAGAMIEHYEDEGNFQEMVSHFTKLNSLYICLVYSDQGVMDALMEELFRIVRVRLEALGRFDPGIYEDVKRITQRMVCRDLLQEEYSEEVRCSGRVAALVLGDRPLQERDSVLLRVSRPADYVALCRYHLQPDGRTDMSLHNLARFLEVGGFGTLTNKVEVVDEA